MLRKHGVHIPLTAAVSLANAFPGPIKDGSLERRYLLALARKGYITANSKATSLDEVADYEFTREGVAAAVRIARAEEEFKAQPKRKYERRAKPVSAA